MENKTNKYIAVDYQLYTIDNEGVRELVEETKAGQPFQFITGFGSALEDFEEAVENLAKDETFDFELDKEKAFGDFEESRVVSLDKNIFTVDGRFDSENVHKGAMIPLQNEDGNHFIGRVLEITADKVRIDLNHPLAGKKLNFKGKVVENREATMQEIQAMFDHMNGKGGCGGGCEGCKGGCGDHKQTKENNDGCCGSGCGHCH